MKLWTIQRGSVYMQMREDGCIRRPELNSGFSGQWRVTGAIRLNNFGRIVERFTLRDIQTRPIEWRHKNGKQRVHITDFDHGTGRVWMSPTHRVWHVPQEIAKAS